MAELREEGVTKALVGKIGVKADIHIDAGLYKGHYASSLEEIRGDLLGLAHPLRRQGLLPIYREVEMGLFLHDESAPLYMKVLSQRCDLSGQIPLLWVRPVGSVEKIQRRRFLRVPCLISTEFWILDHELQEPLSGFWRASSVLDVSLGGARLQYREKKRLLEKDMSVLFFLELQGVRFLCAGDVVWAPPRKGDDIFEVGVEFGGMPRSMDKALRVFIRKQEMLKKE